MLLLHGFPQDASAFDEVLPRLAAAGYRAVALTQRGFAPTSRGGPRSAYRLAELAEDALAAAAALGGDPPHLVGHDLGALIGWHLAARRPESIRTLTAVSVPHPAAFVAALGTSLQPLRSAYVPLLRQPWLAEVVLGAGGGAVLRAALRSSGLPQRRVDRYVDGLLVGGGLRAATAWYRATRAWEMAATPPARVPTTFVWSDGDLAIDRVGAEATARHVDAPYRFEALTGTSHWIPEQRPDTLAGLVAERAASRPAA